MWNFGNEMKIRGYFRRHFRRHFRYAEIVGVCAHFLVQATVHFADANIFTEIRRRIKHRKDKPAGRSRRLLLKRRLNSKQPRHRTIRIFAPLKSLEYRPGWGRLADERHHMINPGARTVSCRWVVSEFETENRSFLVENTLPRTLNKSRLY